MIRNHKIAVILVSVSAVLLLGLGSWAVWGNCGACGTVTKSCPADCTKPCCKMAAETKPTAEPAEIGTAALKTLINAKVPMVLLDARGPRADRIPGAVPLSVDADEDAVKKAAPSTEALVVTYCGNLKCPLSVKLAERLRGMGYKNVLEYRPGIKGWVDSGGEVEKAG